MKKVLFFALLSVFFLNGQNLHQFLHTAVLISKTNIEKNMYDIKIDTNSADIELYTGFYDETGKLRKLKKNNAEKEFYLDQQGLIRIYKHFTGQIPETTVFNNTGQPEEKNWNYNGRRYSEILKYNGEGFLVQTICAVNDYPENSRFYFYTGNRLSKIEEYDNFSNLILFRTFNSRDLIISDGSNEYNITRLEEKTYSGSKPSGSKTSWLHNGKIIIEKENFSTTWHYYLNTRMFKSVKYIVSNSILENREYYYNQDTVNPALVYKRQENELNGCRYTTIKINTSAGEEELIQIRRTSEDMLSIEKKQINQIIMLYFDKNNILLEKKHLDYDKQLLGRYEYIRKSAMVWQEDYYDKTDCRQKRTIYYFSKPADGQALLPVYLQEYGYSPLHSPGDGFLCSSFIREKGLIKIEYFDHKLLLSGYIKYSVNNQGETELRYFHIPPDKINKKEFLSKKTVMHDQNGDIQNSSEFTYDQFGGNIIAVTRYIGKKKFFYKSHTDYENTILAYISSLY